MIATVRISRWLSLAPIGGLLLLPACGGDEAAPPVPPPIATVNEVVAAAGWFPTFEPDSTAFVEDRFDSTGGDEELSCRVYEGEQQAVFARLTFLDAGVSFDYPGAILQFATLPFAAPLSVVADRAGGDVVLSAPAGGEVPGSVTVVDKARVDAWRRDALDQLGAVPPGPWRLVAGAVYSAQQVALLGGVSPPALTAEAAGRLAFGDGVRGRALVRLERTHHTVAAIWPGSAGAAFAPDVVGADVADQMDEGNPPVWVDTVDFGQLLLVLVESSASPDEVLAAATRSFAAAASGVDPVAGTLVHDLPDLDVKIFAAGADAEAAETAALAGQQALTAFLQAAPGDAAALPAVSASLAALRNGGPVSFASTATFADTRCEVYEPVFETVLWGYEARDAHTVRRNDDLYSAGLAEFAERAVYLYEGGTQNFTCDFVTYVPDLKGSGGPATWTVREPFLVEDALNGYPVIEIYELALPDGVLHSELQFDGSALVGSDYTIFVVMGLPSNIHLTIATSGNPIQFSRRNTPNYFLHGVGGGQYGNLLIGYELDPTEDYFVFKHTPAGLELVVDLDDLVGWHVHAFTFGGADGMAVYLDGELVGEDVFINQSLREFYDATLGTRWFGLDGYAMSVLWLAEIVAYDGYGNATKVADETARLRAKYGF